MARVMGFAGSILALSMLVPPALGADSGRWIHVRVDEDGDRGSRVDVQVPLGMISAVLPTLKAKIDLQGHVDVGDGDLSLPEMRAYWAAVKDAKDGNYVTVRDGSDEVRVAKRNGMVHVDVSENGGTGKVKLRVPVPLVEAVLGDGDTLDLDAVVRALGTVPSGELISVDDDDGRVRIWIDDRPEPSRDDTP